MGIFDNVNWQQMMPMLMGSMAAGAAYGDPASGPVLAQSGWNAVQQYMRQQQMQQQREEFEQRQKQVDKEIGLREKYLGLAEADDERKRLAQLQEDAMGAALPEIFEHAQKSGANSVSPSVAWGIYKAKADELGVKADASLFMKSYNESKILMGQKGPVLYKLGPGGRGLVMYDHLTGQEVSLIDEGFTGEQAEMFQKSPEMLRKLAQGQLATAESVTDPKRKAALVNGASALNNWATEIEKGKKTQDKEQLSFRLKQVESVHQAEDDTFFAKYGKPEGGVFPLTRSDEENAKVADAYAKMKMRHALERAAVGGVDLGSAKKQVKPGAGVKGLENKSETWQLAYAGFLQMAKEQGKAGDEAVAWAVALADMAETRPAEKKKVSEKKKAQAAPVAQSVPEYEAQRQMWQANPMQPMPGPLMNPNPMAKPLDYEDQMRKEAIRKQMFRGIGPF